MPTKVEGPITAPTTELGIFRCYKQLRTFLSTATPALGYGYLDPQHAVRRDLGCWGLGTQVLASVFLVLSKGLAIRSGDGIGNY